MILTDRFSEFSFVVRKQIMLERNIYRYVQVDKYKVYYIYLMSIIKKLVLEKMHGYN